MAEIITVWRTWHEPTNRSRWHNTFADAREHAHKIYGAPLDDFGETDYGEWWNKDCTIQIRAYPVTLSKQGVIQFLNDFTC